MNILIATLALAAAPAAPADHSQHSPAQHAQHQAGGHAQHQQGKHEGGSCCKEVNGKMECQMMKEHGGHKGGQASDQGHSGH